jgi:hypothetical protein
MKRIVTAAISVAFAGLLLPPATVARAQATPPRATVASQPMPTDASAQSRARRPLRRLPIYPRQQWEPEVYPRYNPGPNAVRDCTATYVQEYRPSGTVIVPRMNCYWRRG